jgi:hypothetical protein
VLVFADGLTLDSKRTPLESVVVNGQPPLFLDAFYETVVNDRAVAAAAMEADREISLGDEEQEEEEIGADAESRAEQVEYQN